MLVWAGAGAAQRPRGALLPNTPVGAFVDYVTGIRDRDTVSHPATFRHIDAAGRVTTRPVDELRPLLAGCKPGATEESTKSFKWSATCAGPAPDSQLVLTVLGTSSAVTDISVRRGADAVVTPPAPISHVNSKKRR